MNAEMRCNVMPNKELCQHLWATMVGLYRAKGQKIEQQALVEAFNRYDAFVGSLCWKVVKMLLLQKNVIKVDNGLVSLTRTGRKKTARLMVHIDPLLSKVKGADLTEFFPEYVAA